MKDIWINISLIVVGVLVSTLSFLVSLYFLLGLIPISILALLVVKASIDQKSLDIQNKMEELSNGKIWSLRVKSVCPVCDNHFEYDFDLGTRFVDCTHCGKKVKLIVDITPIPSQDI